MLARDVPQVLVHRTTTPGEADALLVPRDDFVAEAAVGPGTFELVAGPFRSWERHVEVAAGAHEGVVAVTERVRFRLAFPLWSIVFTPLVRRSIRQGRPAPGQMPWWAPPDRLEARTATVLALLCSLMVVTGYLGTLLTQTNTFFREDFGVSEATIGWLLGLVRVGALLALGVVALADRRGRRRVLIVASVLGCVVTAVGAFAPNVVWLGASQTVARSFSMAMAILAAIVAVEETPARSRAFAVSVLALTAGLGVGVAVMLLPVAGLAEGAWRVLFLIPLLVLPGIAAVARKLPETRRFDLTQQVLAAPPPARGLEPADPAATRPAADERGSRWGTHAGRLALLALSALLLEAFVSPAAGFLNEYLRTERSFSAVQISLFTVLTNTPGAIGIVLGGRLADRWGRRAVGALGVAAGAGFTVLMYLATGWALWAWSIAGAVVGGVAVPALAVYGPELFPTAARGRANGTINLFRVGGSMAGLIGAGLLADRLAGGLPSAMSLLAIGPALVVVLVLTLYPETSGRELEELNPQDAPLGREVLGLEGVDPDVLPGGWPPRAEPPPPRL